MKFCLQRTVQPGGFQAIGPGLSAATSAVTNVPPIRTRRVRSTAGTLSGCATYLQFSRGVASLNPGLIAVKPPASKTLETIVGRLAITFLSLLALHAPASADTGTAFFEKEIAPILKQRCYECHSHKSGKAKGGLVLDSRSGWETGGGSGPAIVPGKPDESLLMEAVRYGNEDLQMPPKQKLSANEIALLEKWVATGAPDPRKAKASKVDPAKLWALQPIRNPAIPEVNNAAWLRDDSDAFLLARLEKAKLRPTPDADRHTLLRRVTFDLTGLPPTPEEIAAFVNDSSGSAYAKVIDRLLGSDAFGDHWARHWFDISCYADLAGIGGQTLIRDAWRYRDYVIASLNADKPFDRFIHEQIAGDLLPYNSIEQRRERIIATGYLAIGPWTISNYIKKQLDADVVDHQIDRIGRTFLGQTISCARCHDHKFDPIPTADYYAMAGIFHSTLTTSYDGPGVWSTITEITLPSPETAPEEIARRKQELKDLRQRQRTLQAELTPLILSIPGASTANVLTLNEGIAANAADQKYKLSFQAAPTVWGSVAQANAATDGLQIELLRSDGGIVAGFRHDPGAWSRASDSQEMKPVRFPYTGDGSGAVRIRITSATPGSAHFGGAVDDIAIHTDGGQIVFQEDFNGLQRGPIVGKKQPHTGLTVLAKTTVPGWDGSGINHSHAVDLGMGDYAIQFFGGRAGSLAAAKPVTKEQKQAHARALKMEQEQLRIARQIAALDTDTTPDKALAVRDVDAPFDSPIYRRGSFQSLGETVPRGFVQAVNVSRHYNIPKGNSGRLQLAQWLTDPTNPLTSRVLVNRIWHHLFGQGLVRTVDYFGVHGETPSHPELLDFLAHRFREDDQWSLKKTVRRLVMSRAYRMSSAHNAQAKAADPDNRLLWHMPRRRLSAEAIRDTMLLASGQLDPARGGPSLGLELKGNMRGLGGKVNLPTWGGKIADYIKLRRTVYLPFKRQRPSGDLEILGIFDFPHPSDIVGARPQTTVATQALFLMNSPFVKQQAGKLAERLAKDEPTDERARINRLYLLTVNRPAAAAESETAEAFLDQCAKDLTKAKNSRQDAWVQLCHAILGSNQFLFRE
jgi:hypothetical protein